AAQEFVVPVLNQGLGGLAVRLRVLLLRVDVGGVLVVSDVVEVRVNTELVERAAKERRRGHHAAHVEVGARQQQDRLAGGGEVVGTVRGELEIGHAEFSYYLASACQTVL